MTTQSFTVIGMTCSHCVNAVTEEVEALDGVESVLIDLESGRLDVVGSDDLSPSLIRGAVEEAGYAVSS